MKVSELGLIDGMKVKVVQTWLDPHVQYRQANGRLYIPLDCTVAQLCHILDQYRQQLAADSGLALDP